MPHLIKSPPGTKFALTSKGIRPSPSINTPITYSLPLPLFKVGNWVLSCELGSTLVVLSEVHHHWHTHPSFHPYYLSLLYLGPPLVVVIIQTCPNRLKLVEHQESRSSTIFLSKSMSHSRGVNSARGRMGSWVDVSVHAFTQGCGCTLGDGHL